jgi:glucosamine--fructose-6-phosphate aminotransferase (isomerizing)
MLLDLAWKYKSNVNFIRFCKSTLERDKINLLCEQIYDYSEKRRLELPLIDKSSSLLLYKEKIREWEYLEDTHWFFSSELNKTKELIESLAGQSSTDISDASIILLRDITKIIHAIDNRLELRGRDSFGLSISLSSEHFSSDKIDRSNIIGNKEELFYSRNKKIGTYTFVFKSCNSIGGLGDNANEIKNLIRNNKLFLELVKEGLVTSATIIGHTRWASVGAVSLDNTHPIGLAESNSNSNNSHVLTCLNGDIYNYKEILAEAKITNVLSKDETICTSDCLASSAYFLGKKDISIDSMSKMASNFFGSYAIAIQHSEAPEKLFLVKKGIQGLYLGFSYDGTLFASDVYGLVETCRYFIPVDSDVALELSASNIGTALNPKTSILNLKTESIKNLIKDDLRITNITTRDIDKRGYQHFLEKEIYETRDIVEKTLNAYLQPEKLVEMTSLHSAINITENQIPSFIVDKLNNREIKKVVITGMGTCYTAAVAISMYMRALLKSIIPDMTVEPHIASEGSAFYVEPDMRDTLVIVIAQSGTTVDTNVYAQMAKERGASSLAIANKREGDVTFIVDGTAYIGEGRDIEVAVPSTKTYTAQVVLGYIVSIYLASNIAEKEVDKKRLFEDINNLRSSVHLINESFSVIEAFSDFRKITKSALRYQSWYVVRDGSTNSVCADEIRIKYSENCYQSVPSLTMTEAIRLEVQNSFLIFITEDYLSALAQTIRKLADRGNTLVVISINGGEESELQGLIELGLLYLIRMPYAPNYFTFIPTIIAGQFLSYLQAIELDKRTDYFTNVLENLDSKIELQSSINKLGSALHAGYLNQGYSNVEIFELHQRLERFLSDTNDRKLRDEVKDLLTILAEQSRRTIDTIKHQAKTITVGALRENSFERESLENMGQNIVEKNSNNKISSLELFEHAILGSKTNQNLLLPFKEGIEIIISSHGLDESAAYNVINIIKNYASKIGVQLKVRLAQPYDYLQNRSHLYEYWVVLSDRNCSEYYTHHNENQFSIFDFSQWDSGSLIKSFFGFEIDENSSYAKAIWSTLVGIVLSRRLISCDQSSFNNSGELIKRVNSELLDKLNSLMMVISYLDKDEDVDTQITYASKLFLTRKNWKAIGSGVNFNLAKYAAKNLIKELNRACAFDVLENHKHIDMSAESAILVFISGIWKHGYQEDALSEIKKMLSHNTLPVVVTEINDNRFDDFSVLVTEINGKIKEVGIPVIKLPKTSLNFSYPLNVILLDRISEKLKMFRDSKNTELTYRNAVVSLDSEVANANLWK